MNETKQKIQFAQQQAQALFAAAEGQGLIMPGKLESKLSEEIVALGKDSFGIESYWHKKIVRTGINTLHSFSGDPADLVIQPGDILFIDFGPIVNGYEADFARTYVLGNDPLKLKLKADVEEAWQVARGWYFQQSELTGAEYFNYLTALAKQYGWEYGGEIGGHIVGPFPHEQPDDPNNLCLDIHPGNHSSILLLDKEGNSRNWILEIQFVDRVNNIGGFFEQLLN